LTAVIGLEIAFVGNDDRPEERAAPPAAPGAGGAHPPGAGAAKLVDVILGRPLFNSDRRPTADDNSLGRAGQSGDLPRLAGVIVTPDGRRAIFEPGGGKRPVVVDVGDALGAWRVREIATDAVTVVGPGGAQRLEPKPDPSHTSTPPNATNAASAPPPAALPSPPQAKAASVSPPPPRLGHGEQ
jgi:hypothetical protein